MIDPPPVHPPVHPSAVTERPPVRHSVTNARIFAVRGSEARERPDVVVTEEPMEIRLAGPGQEPASVAITMRTPGADFELAGGFLFGAGLIGAGDVATVRYCDVPAGAEQQYNIVTVSSRHRTRPPPGRAFAVNASCGLCGTTSLDDLAGRCPTVHGDRIIAGSVIATLAARLRAEQRLFDATGGLHGAALFEPDGGLLAVREDVGRHNAVDKVVGFALLAGRLPLDDHLLMVSGRVSFEIVEKAAMAGIALVGAVSAPTSLAVDAARRFGVTLVGFLRGERYNVYAHRGRLDVGR